MKKRRDEVSKRCWLIQDQYLRKAEDRLLFVEFILLAGVCPREDLLSFSIIQFVDAVAWTTIVRYC